MTTIDSTVELILVVFGGLMFTGLIAFIIWQIVGSVAAWLNGVPLGIDPPYNGPDDVIKSRKP